MDNSITSEKRKSLEDAFRNFESSHIQEERQEKTNVSSLSTADFCTNWQKAKEVLEFISSLPMIPSKVKDGIGIVISAGDTVSRILCS